MTRQARGPIRPTHPSAHLTLAPRQATTAPNYQALPPRLTPLIPRTSLLSALVNYAKRNTEKQESESFAITRKVTRRSKPETTLPVKCKGTERRTRKRRGASILMTASIRVHLTTSTTPQDTAQARCTSKELCPCPPTTAICRRQVLKCTRACTINHTSNIRQCRCPSKWQPTHCRAHPADM